MLTKELYIQLRKAAIPEFRNETIKEIENRYCLNYRTIAGLVSMIDAEHEISRDILDRLTDVSFYTVKNCISLAKDGFSDIIPHNRYEDPVFLKGAKIAELPAGFLQGCSSIKSFLIRSGIRSVGENAFRKCSFLERLTFEIVRKKGVVSIGPNAFRGCMSLKLTELPDTIRTIESGAFRACTDIDHICLPDKLSELGARAFSGCTSLEYVTVPENLKIGEKSFYGCTSLKQVDGTVSAVMDEAFFGCMSLKNISLSSQAIGKRAFSGCVNLEDVRFTGAPSRIRKDAFSGCINLKRVSVNDLPYRMQSVNGYTELTKDIRIDNGKMSRTISYGKNIYLPDPHKNVTCAVSED